MVRKSTAVAARQNFGDLLTGDDDLRSRRP